MMIQIADSERLSYALMDESHAEWLYQLDQDPEVMKYINGGKPSSRKDIQEIMLPRMASYRNPEKGWGLWMVSTIDGNDFIGWVLVRPMHYFNELRDDADWELGWRFMQKSWGLGYATEAAQAVISALKAQCSQHRFSAIAFPDNSASINIMKKLGMSYVKTGIHKDPLGDEEVVYYTVDSNG